MYVAVFVSPIADNAAGAKAASSGSNGQFSVQDPVVPGRRLTVRAK